MLTLLSLLIFVIMDVSTGMARISARLSPCIDRSWFGVGRKSCGVTRETEANDNV